MEFSNLIFYVFSVVLLASGVMVITSRNPVHAVLFLVLAFCTAGAIWMLMHAEFLAIAIIVVYVGAVMVLFLFVVMLLDINIDRLREGFWRYLPLGLLVAVLVVFQMAVVLRGDYFQLESLAPPTMPAANASNTQELARELFTHYAYPFELASMILLVAMVAAVMLTLRRRENSKFNNPADQIRVKRADRVRIVSMPTERDLPAAPAEAADVPPAEPK
ncbi:NADH-quinone oxidoreductase subunit J [Uliginosibacterium sp. H1]|uniref:NADH-quinone oxidoreductase subunit J n=1 Tax=Uliginosibacterium sp. H1 TaxID=3114757 RepID=UPI002E16CF79|nr:NADH-quinone oxidoreductase subunit J [Uliginosibacterium sp. H1]